MKKVTKIDGVQKNTAINSRLRVAAYCRVSTGSDAQLESLEAQKSHYEQYINSREDWQFAGLYFDEGITGTKAEKRPELLRLITDCEARRIDFVITKSISHSDFDAANALVNQRAAEKGIEKGSDKYQQRYAFSGKIICGECGDTFKRRIHTCNTYKYVAWACNTHLKNKESCHMKYVRDDEIKTAFITMLNKLIYGYRLILTPYLKVLENSSGDEAIHRIQHLEQLIAQNSEQREALTKLMAQGYIDQILYNQETNALLLQAETYRSDIEAITIGMTGDAAKVTETNLLLHFVSHTDMLTAYSEELFENYADHIEVMSRNEIRFVMKCGLTFTERIDD